MDQKDLLVSSQVISCHTGIISKAGICNIIQHKSVSSKGLFDADLRTEYNGLKCFSKSVN